MSVSPSQERVAAAVERCSLPAILFPADIARHFDLRDAGQATAALRAGLFGPWFLLDGRPAVLCEELKEHLRLRMAQRLDKHKELIPGGICSLRGEEGHGV